MIKRVLFALCAITMPWLVFLIKDSPLNALIALVLQATIIGWLPAAIWAWRAVHQPAKSASKEH